MPEWPKLSKAPVREAILSIGYALPEDVKPEALDKYLSGMEESYPEQKPKFEFIVNGEMKDGSQNFVTQHNRNGFRLRNESRKKVIQVDLNKLSFHQIEPYADWEQFNTDAFFAIERFITIFSNVSIKHISLRYINSLPLPKDFLQGLDDYIRILPTQIESMKEVGIGKFFIQFELNFQDQINAIVNQSFEPPTDQDVEQNNIKITLDITVQKPLREGIHSLDELRPVLNSLRTLKNKVFFESITDKTLDLYR